LNTGSARRTDKRTTEYLRNERGSVFIEFAFAVTVLTVIFMMAVTYSFLFADYYSIQKVAREGAREASITLDENLGRTKALQSAVLWGLDPERLTLEFAKDRYSVRCTARYRAKPFNRTFPGLVGSSVLNDFDLSAGATFYLAQKRQGE